MYKENRTKGDYLIEKKFLILKFFLLFILLLSGCNKAETIQHIEVFVTETSEQNDEGFYETTGYKKVNALTTIEEGKNHIATDGKQLRTTRI